MAGTRIASISGLRGVVGDGLDPVAVVEYAAAYASECEPGAIVVGHDARKSSHVFLPAVISGVTATGRDAILAGAAATPTVGFLVRERQAVGGVVITASHNPPSYNGLKLFQPRGMVLSAEQGMDVLERWRDREFRWAEWSALGRLATIEDPDERHLQRILEIIDVESIRARKYLVLMDSCHGAGGRLASRMLRALGCTPIIVGGEPDGCYDHPPEPTESNLSKFTPLVAAAGAAIGFAQDPDADRLAIIDERGRYIGEELTLALAALRRLEQVQGPVVLNMSTSRVTEEIAREHGCPVVRTPVGEIHVVEGMLAEDAVLGGEGNGGVIDPRIGYVRDSFVAMALVLDLLATSDQPLSSWVDRLPKYAMVKAKYPLAAGREPRVDPHLWSRIAAAYPDARSDLRDGLRLDWDAGWVHVRSSNTEPIVRVIAEAREEAIARQLASAIGRWISGDKELPV